MPAHPNTRPAIWPPQPQCQAPADVVTAHIRHPLAQHLTFECSLRCSSATSASFSRTRTSYLISCAWLAPIHTPWRGVYRRLRFFGDAGRPGPPKIGASGPSPHRRTPQFRRFERLLHALPQRRTRAYHKPAIKRFGGLKLRCWKGAGGCNAEIWGYEKDAALKPAATAQTKNNGWRARELAPPRSVRDRDGRAQQRVDTHTARRRRQTDTEWNGTGDMWATEPPRKEATGDVYVVEANACVIVTVFVCVWYSLDEGGGRENDGNRTPYRNSRSVGEPRRRREWRTFCERTLRTVDVRIKLVHRISELLGKLFRRFFQPNRISGGRAVLERALGPVMSEPEPKQKSKL